MLPLVTFVVSAALAAAQDTPPKPAFEAASVKPASAWFPQSSAISG
jgi:hypothetical protein